MLKAIYLPSVVSDTELSVYTYDNSSGSFVADIKDDNLLGESQNELIEDFVNVHAVMNDPDWIVSFETEDGIVYRLEKTHPLDDNLLSALLQEDDA